jgi:hypothetical protein
MVLLQVFALTLDGYYSGLSGWQNMYLDTSKLMVMNQDTWNMMVDKLAEGALGREDPIGYLSRYDGIPVIIDNELPYNSVEVYEKWMYDLVKYQRGANNAGDVG